MKRIELTLTIACIISVILNFTLIQKDFVMYAMLSLALFYLIFGFAVFNNVQLRHLFRKDSYREIRKLKILGAVATGITLFLAIFAIFTFIIDLFFVALLTIALLPLTIISIIGGLRYITNKSNYCMQILKRTVVFVSLCLAFLFTSQSAWVSIKYRNHPEYLEVLKEIQTSPHDMELMKKKSELSKDIYKKK